MVRVGSPKGYSWIADQRDALEKSFFKEPEGLRQFRDHRWKALGKKNSDLTGIFFCDHFFASYFLNQVKIWPQQKYTGQNQIRLVEYSSAEVSDPSEVPRIKGKLMF